MLSINKGWNDFSVSQHQTYHMNWLKEVLALLKGEISWWPLAVMFKNLFLSLLLLALISVSEKLNPPPPVQRITDYCCLHIPSDSGRHSKPSGNSKCGRSILKELVYLSNQNGMQVLLSFLGLPFCCLSSEPAVTFSRSYGVTMVYAS